MQLVNYADEVALEGVVLKDETVIQSDYTGVVKYEYENSQKVLSGATVATVYANQSDLLADNQIETLTRRVELLNQVGSENAATTINASSTITNLQRAQMNLIYDAQMGEYDSLSDDSDTLLEGLLQQQKLLDEDVGFFFRHRRSQRPDFLSSGRHDRLLGGDHRSFFRLFYQ